MPEPYRSFALISRAAIARNYRSVRAAAGPGVEVVGVVKANAYGHGAVEVSRVLVAEGACWLAVSSVEEGVELRRAGVAARILVMAGFLPFEGEALVEYDLTPVLPSLDDVAEFDRLAQESGRSVPYHLKIDTGMGRLGTRAAAEEIARAVLAARHARVEGLMTHLASAGDFAGTQTEEQIACFRAVRAALEAAGVRPPYAHMAASNAIAYPRENAGCNMVRAGLALYGYVSPARGEAPARACDVEPVLAWKARILTVKDIPEGALVGYGGTYRAPRPMRIAIVGAGYADGVFQCLSNRGYAIAAGKRVPILGSVCMDVIAIDVSHAPALSRGDEVTLLGAENGVAIDAAEIAALAGTIPYDVLCRIGARVRRVYR